MTKYLVIGGNGPVGRHLLDKLAAAGDDAVSVSRTSGLCFDATDADRLSRAAEGAAAIFFAAMPRYDRWPAEFPPLMASAVTAAERTGAQLISIGNLYPYGADAPALLREDLPARPTTIKGRVRAEMWQRALDSRAPATEIRGSDYLGRGAVSIVTFLVQPMVVAGATARAPFDLDAVRPWTFVGDVAATAIAVAKTPGAAKYVVHVPSIHASLRTIAARLAELAGAPPPTLERMPHAELVALGARNSIIHELVEMAYLFDRPWRLDATHAERVLGVQATPLDAALRDALDPRLDNRPL
jgi:nucleoside-diphosphate-sugar epimerase